MILSPKGVVAGLADGHDYVIGIPADRSPVTVARHIRKARAHVAGSTKGGLLMPEKIFRLRDVIERLGVCKETVYRWERDGKVPPPKRRLRTNDGHQFGLPVCPKTGMRWRFFGVR